MTTPADWYPDPGGRHEVRYWDGSRWTDWATDDGVQNQDPLPPPPPPGDGLDSVDSAMTVGNEGRSSLVSEQVHGTGRRGVGVAGPVAGGSGSIFDEPILVVNQKAKIIESLVAGERHLGSIKAENWRAWNFQIVDGHGVEIARITKTWEGLAKTMFTTADNYVVQVVHRAPEPLNSLVVASALSVDTALTQDSRGFG